MTMRVRYGNQEMNINNVFFAFHNGHQIYRELLLSLIFKIPFYKRKSPQNAPRIRRITVSLRLHRTAAYHPSPTTCSRKAKYKVYLAHRPILNVSKDGDCTTPLDEQFQLVANDSFSCAEHHLKKILAPPSLLSLRRYL